MCGVRFRLVRRQELKIHLAISNASSYYALKGRYTCKGCP